MWYYVILCDNLCVWCQVNKQTTQKRQIWTYFTINDGNQSKMRLVKISRGETIATQVQKWMQGVVNCAHTKVVLSVLQECAEKQFSSASTETGMLSLPSLTRVYALLESGSNSRHFVFIFNDHTCCSACTGQLASQSLVKILFKCHCQVNPVCELSFPELSVAY